MSSAFPTFWIRPSRTNIAPSATMPSSRNSGPTRGRAGPASVTTCEQLITARVLLSFSEDINRDADSIRYQHSDHDLQREYEWISDFGDRSDRETDIDERDNEARRTRDLQPPGRSDAERLHPKQRNCK